MKKTLSLIICFALLVTSITPIYAEEQQNDGEIHKVLINSYVISWAENGKNFVANIDGNSKTKANPGSTITSKKDIKSLSLTHLAKPENMQFVGVETYNGSNFDFNNDKYFHWNRCSEVSNENDYKQKYLKISATNINYSNYKLENGKFSTHYSASLVPYGASWDFAKQIRAGILSVDDIYNFFGGKDKVDQSMKNTLENIRKTGVDANDEGYIYLIPTIITFKEKSGLNIKVQNLKQSYENGNVNFNAEVLLVEGAEKVNNVDVQGKLISDIANPSPVNDVIPTLEKMKPIKVDFNVPFWKDEKQKVDGTVEVIANTKHIPEETFYEDNHISDGFLLSENAVEQKEIGDFILDNQLSCDKLYKKIQWIEYRKFFDYKSGEKVKEHTRSFSGEGSPPSGANYRTIKKWTKKFRRGRKGHRYTVTKHYYKAEEILGWDTKFTAQIKGESKMNDYNTKKTKMKSGYGVNVNATNAITTNYDKQIPVVTKATSTFPKLGGGKDVITMQKIEDRWYLPKNSNSKKVQRREYFVPLDWADNSKFNSTVKFYTSFKPAGLELGLCINKDVTIQGNMYEDSYTAPVNENDAFNNNFYKIVFRSVDNV